jgi:hypothetical protein
MNFAGKTVRFKTVSKFLGVRAAGMSFPFPQREVRVLGDSKAEKTAGSRSGGCTEPAQRDK